ncbi:MAG: cardiolipin synthase [Bacillus subtilis]|nr:cardiolipin synthase [Bacillus subtilis]
MRIILRQEYAYNKSYWIIIMLLNPIIGIIAYFVFARDFRHGKLIKNRPLIASKHFLTLEEPTNPNYALHPFGSIFSFVHQITGRSVYENDTYTEVLNNGDAFFPALIEHLKRAEVYIFMEFYILKTDDIGKKVLEILKEKAMAGIDVYLIYDHFGSERHLDRQYLKELRASGVNIGVFDPQKISLLNSNFNFRNHRKAIVIDGYIGFVGGMNLADEYNHKSPKFGFWRDTHLLVRGNGVTSIQNVFVKDWYYITEEVLQRPLDKTVEAFQGLFAVVESGPDFESGLIKDVYFKMLTEAKRTIQIVTPYLIIEPEMMAAIKIAAKSGVVVQLLVPGKHDYAIVGFATQSYYEQLLSYGVEIYEYTNRFVHSKLLIIDETVASVGSVNFDPRSFRINFEVTALFMNEAVDELVRSFHEDIGRSARIDYESIGKSAACSSAWFKDFSIYSVPSFRRIPSCHFPNLLCTPSLFWFLSRLFCRHFVVRQTAQAGLPSIPRWI